jgi:hypothetical protein
MPRLDDQIATLQDRLSRLKLRQQRIDERKRAILAARERKVETRRRILVGGAVMAKAARGEINADLMKRWLDEELSRANDRALFDLPPRAESDERMSAGSRTDTAQDLL